MHHPLAIVSQEWASDLTWLRPSPSIHMPRALSRTSRNRTATTAGSRCSAAFEHLLAAEVSRGETLVCNHCCLQGYILVAYDGGAQWICSTHSVRRHKRKSNGRANSKTHVCMPPAQ